MKTMKQKFSFILLLLTATVANSFAQGDIVTQATAGQAFTITSTQNASAVNAVRYQWYRNGAPIPGATGANYTIPAAYAYGDMVRFQRMATTAECAGTSEAFANSVTITFTGFIMPAGCQLVIGGVCWADRNVDTYRNFATRADMQTRFYQWGNTTAWSPADPISPAWNTTVNDAMTWDPTWDPCPMGWRMPSQADAQALIGSGSVYVTANTRGAAIPGHFVGYNNATCTLPNNMSGCIFLPATNLRNYNNGTIRTTEWINDGYGWYWTNTPTNSTSAADFRVHTSGFIMETNHKNYAWAIRCVQ